MLNIDDELLLQRVGNYSSFTMGKKYYSNGKIVNVKYDEHTGYIQGIVKGSEYYKVDVQFNSNGKLIYTYCSCPAFHKYPGDCKHVVALLSYVKNSPITAIMGRNKDEEAVLNLINSFSYEDEVDKVPVNIEYNYEFNYNKFDGMERSSFLNLRMGEDRLYVVKSIRKFFESLEDKEEIVFGKHFTFNPHKHSFKEEDKEIMDFLKILYENHQANYSRYYNDGESIFKDKRILFTPKSLHNFFQLMKDKSFNATIMGKTYDNVQILKKDLPISVSIGENDRDLVLQMEYEPNMIPIISNGEYFFNNGNIYNISSEQREGIIPLYNEVIRNNGGVLSIPSKYRESFISEVLPKVKDIADLKLSDSVKEAIYSPEFTGEIYFDRFENMITGKVSFIYEDVNINPFSSVENSSTGKEKILLRDVKKERAILKVLEESAFKVINGEIYMEEEEKIYDFVFETIPELQKLCHIYYSESFKDMTFRESSYFSGGIQLNEETDMLDFDFETDDIDMDELGNIFGALKEKKRYYRLRDGSFLPLDNSELAYMGEILDYLNVSNDELAAGNVSIPKFRAAYLDNYLKDRQINFIKKNLSFKKLIDDINEPEDIDYEIPKELEGVLRDYQRFGFKWLKVLSKYGFGGVLADDMGLGKTLEVITFLLSENEENGSWPSLVVAPSSVIYNWEAEIDKFAPKLKVLVVSGSKSERTQLVKDMEKYDVVVTSYPLMRKDLDLYKDFTFRYAILDEAQHIKNPKSLNAKSVKRIKAKNYFALTGTPMENSLTELWSIFDYLMPGYLLSHGKFVEKYEKPIVKDQDGKALRDLNNHIRPFILRRLKKDVLKELPEKIEQQIAVDMTIEQRKLYLAYLQAIKGEIEEEISVSGFNRSQIKILAGLTRLRQICCHPGMFVEDYSAGSGKLDSLEEILVDAIEGGHRVLLFSQFTTMLDIIRETLKKNNIEYMYLDGSTDVKERGKLVEEFNKGKGDVFLISLRAGGTGINLTGADMVVHFDPWWNPAVEDQATDRAYRIGQKNTVQVIKLITKGTIEEKIFKLQETKKEMIDKVITEGETLVSKLSEEEIKYLFDI